MEDTFRPIVEVGWVLAGEMSPIDALAAASARDDCLELLRDFAPQLEWEMPMVRRREAARAKPTPILDLLDVGVTERDAAHWDFTIVLTETDLQNVSKPFALGAPAASLGVAALSTARIDPATELADISEKERTETLRRRIRALALHLFGHLTYLPHRESADDLMFDLAAVEDLDQMHTYAPADAERMVEQLRGVADQRLEESAGARNAGWFYVRATGINAPAILRSLLRMKPWEFPFRLSSLTTPAVSALFILLMTAEAWDLGMSQPLSRVLTLSVLSLFGASTYVLKQQHMLERRRRTLTEQYVVSHVTAILGVFVGLVTTFIVLFCTSFGISHWLFEDELITEWAVSRHGVITERHHLLLAGTVAAVGLIIGALGTSFERHNFVRHVAVVDEET